MKQPIIRNRIFHELRDGIVSGKHPAGYRFPIEPKLPVELGISRKTLRAVLSLLETEGMVERCPRSGTFVNPQLKTNATKMVALLTTFQKGHFDNYFETLFSEVADSNIISIVGTIDKDRNWKDTIRKTIAREPDVFLIDVEGRHFNLDELRKACAPIPCCFVNRWDWHEVKPERAVLNDYPAAYGKALSYLKERGNSRILVIGHHNQILPFEREYLKKATMSVDMEFGRELIYVGFEDIEKNPGASFKTNAPTAVFGFSDHIVLQFLQQAMKSGIDTSSLDKVGLFNQRHSNIPGREFTSVRFDFPRIWKNAFDHCNAGGDSFVEYIEPEILIKTGGK